MTPHARPQRLLPVSLAYLEFAHGPAAESQHAPAQRLFEQPTRGRQAIVDLDDAPLREDLRQVAELYANPSWLDESCRPWCRTARKVLAALKASQPR